jgi:hypothetical protein
LTLQFNIFSRARDAALMIAPFSNDPLVQYAGSVKQEFCEGPTKKLILDFVRKQLPVSLKQHFPFVQIPRFGVFGGRRPVRHR